MDNDLISRSAAIDALMKAPKLTRSIIRRVLRQVPEVDAVEVVRCKDCKRRYYNEDREVYCCEAWADGYDTEVRDDCFCSYGERRSDDEAK
jgi:hypothetical protein